MQKVLAKCLENGLDTKIMENELLYVPSQEEIKEIFEKHRHWLKRDCDNRKEHHDDNQ